ncbi:2Fe-2S iron-sulfur cluster-binding protein [Actinoplanes sp. NPDC089786]|uniref:2Fe-2S iron-sulfur cluster-binding protein n=1 Tax=Actinoplanes sp. NPDC089786 TaxID=3155185 RepID=UPI0034204C48
MNWENARRLTAVDEVEATVGRPAAVIMLKQISALDEGCRTILDLCPVAAFGYRDGNGIARTTFIGGRPGFVKVRSPTRISFTMAEAGHPDGPVSFFFLLPGVGELLRVNGSVAARQGAEVSVDIHEAYVHCAQAVLRSRLWHPPAPGPPAAPEPGEGPLSRPGVADFLAAAKFLALSTWDSAGGSDTSPRGDREAVARILDGRTLVIPDRRGNKRADSLHNLLQDDRLSLAALVPGRGGVLHVRGRGAITDDPALLATMALRGMPPHAALLIDVEDAEIAGNDAVARSGMWARGTHLDRGTAPDLMAMAGQHLAARSKAKGLLKVVGAIPGLTRLLRLVMDRAYRSGLIKEGYEEARTVEALREVRIADVRRETPSVVTLVLEDAGGKRGSFDFRAGQFFTLIADIDGRPVRRAYSASSAPGSARLEVTVKRVDGGRFSGHVHRKGDRLAVRGPSGSFHLPPQAPDQLVLIAAGSGVTPMMSIIRAALRQSRIALLYSSRDTDEVIFAAELARLAADHPGRLSVTHVLTRRDGRLDADGIRRWITGLSPARSAHYYVCGPEPLMSATHGVLAGLGVPDDLVHSERYISGADTGTAATSSQEPQEMTVEAVGTVVVEPGQTLLDAGLDAGLPMPYSCTVGNCGDCMVRLVKGEVVQNEPNCLTSQQKAEGYALTCVGYPLSDIVLRVSR